LLKDKVEGGRKNGSVMRWIKLVVAVMISMVMVISTKKVRRFGVAFAIKEGHGMEKHKEGPKNLPKNQRNRVSRNSSVVVRK